MAPHDVNAISSLPLLDEEVLQELKNLDPDGKLMNQLVEMFHSSVHSLLLSLREAVDKKDAVQVHRYARQLTGSTANLGSEAMSYLCHQIEKRSLVSDLEACEPWVQELEALFVRVTQILQTRWCSKKAV